LKTRERSRPKARGWGSFEEKITTILPKTNWAIFISRKKYK
jgi:hypothetical protein